MRWIGSAVSGGLMLWAALLAGAMSPAIAQDASADTAMAAPAEAPEAQRLGRQMYLYDQAAWHATDALAERFDLSAPGDLRGYLVVPLDNGNLSTVFYGEDESGLYEFARYEVAGSKVVGGGIVEATDKPRLAPMLQMMADAKAAAIDELMRQDWRFCSQSQANTLILPPDAQGRVAVYFLTSTTENGVYPFGGHYRVDIAADGSVAGARKFTNTCLNMQLQSGPEGETPVGLGVSHLLDDAPTEIHYFQSHYVPVQLYVIIEEGMWVIERGELVEKIDDFGS